MRYSFLGFGALFGFILSRAGATTYDFYAGLFLFTNLQLLWVIGTAAVVGMVGVAVFKKIKLKALATGEEISFAPKPWKKGMVTGSLVFGLGWGLAGACPGTALAMLGEGHAPAAFTIVGIFLGTYLYGWQQSATIDAAQAPAPVAHRRAA